MLCENCNENEATFHYTEVVNGIMTQHHLCSECAAKMGLTGFAESPSADFLLQDFLQDCLRRQTEVRRSRIIL